MEVTDFKSTSDFVSELTAFLKTKENVDLELIEILENTIIKTNTVTNDFIESFKKIKELAERRAKIKSDEEK